MVATLRLTHKSIGVEVRRGPYDIVVDGQRAGSLDMNDTIEIPIASGGHTLQVRSGRNSAEFRPSTPPKAKPSPSDAPGRVFCRSSSRPSSSPAWRSSSAVQSMINFCDVIVAGGDSTGSNAVLMPVNLSICQQHAVARDEPNFRSTNVHPPIGLCPPTFRHQ